MTNNARVINPSFLIAAVRAGIVRSGLPLPREEVDRLIRQVVKEVIGCSTPYQPPETVTAEEHRLLLMKCTTAFQLLELYTKRDCE